MWRTLPSSLEKIVKYETFSFCTSRKERHMLADYPALLSVPFCGCWIQQTVFSPSDLLPLSVYSKNCFNLPLCWSRAQQKWPRALCVCDPATGCCQETPVCYVVVLQSNTLLCQPVLVLWNIEWEQCRLCHKRRLPISVWLSKSLVLSLQSLVIEIYVGMGWYSWSFMLGVFVLLCFSSASEMSQGESWRLLEGEDETPEVRWV